MSGFIFHPGGRPDWARLTPFGIIAACIGALGTAYTAQYGFGVEPCLLCLYQRIPYAVAGVLALAAIVMPRGRGRIALLALCLPVFLIGAGIAFYHTGVEQHWWASVAGCGGSLASVTSAADLLSGLSAPPPKACDEIDWALFGLSMTVYNTIIFLSLTLATAYGIKRMRPKSY